MGQSQVAVAVEIGRHLESTGGSAWCNATPFSRRLLLAFAGHVLNGVKRSLLTCSSSLVLISLLVVIVQSFLYHPQKEQRRTSYSSKDLNSPNKKITERKCCHGTFGLWVACACSIDTFPFCSAQVQTRICPFSNQRAQAELLENQRVSKHTVS